MKLLKPAGLALTCALLLAGLNLQTRGVIEENQVFFEQQLLRQLVAEVSRKPEINETDRGYRVTDQGKPVAAIKRIITSKGYNGDISMLVAHTPDNAVLGVRVTGHQETPGIGDKIDLSVSAWITQFNGRSPTNTDWSLSPEGDIDGITGATITSRAVTQAIEKALQQ